MHAKDKAAKGQRSPVFIFITASSIIYNTNQTHFYLLLS